MSTAIPVTDDNSHWVQGLSIEISARDTAALDMCETCLAPGTAVYISWVPGTTWQQIVAAAARLRQLGFEPVPHVVARNLADTDEFARYLHDLRTKASVQQALVIGGDTARPVGQFTCSLELLRTGLFEAAGIEKLGIAGYPEGNPRIALARLDAAFLDKVEYAERSSARFYIVTQFCFELDPIVMWIHARRSEGVRLPVHVGLAGPASVASLMKYGIHCGVGNSLKALRLHGAAITRILTETDPGALVYALRKLRTQDPTLGIEGFHVFPFGGLGRLANWLQSM